MFKVPEKLRVTSGAMKSSEADGNNGVFHVRFGPMAFAYCIASDGGFEEEEWEHVSVTMHDKGKTRPATWDEMCTIKDKFWDKEDTVIQYHPAESEYVNNHPHCLHMWRPVGKEIPKPPSIYVGIK